MDGEEDPMIVKWIRRMVIKWPLEEEATMSMTVPAGCTGAYSVPKRDEPIMEEFTVLAVSGPLTLVYRGRWVSDASGRGNIRWTLK
jgi:hypothetical protein